jgi:hypothetical protein
MSRNAHIAFHKTLTDGTPCVVMMEEVHTVVLRDVMLSGFFRLSVGIPELGEPIGTGIYEERHLFVRVLDRLDCRPMTSRGKSNMTINGVKLTVSEVEMIECEIKKLLSYNDKQLLKSLRQTGNKFNAQVRRDSLQTLLKHVSVAHSLKPPVAEVAQAEPTANME